MVWKSTLTGTKKKNTQLQKERNISFEEIVSCLKHDQVLEKMPHPKQDTYPGQEIYFVHCKNYVYYIPFREYEEKIVLITIIPSRKLKRRDLK